MKALQFTIPVAEDNCFMVQEDILPDSIRISTGIMKCRSHGF